MRRLLKAFEAMFSPVVFMIDKPWEYGSIDDDGDGRPDHW
jgi:hypothetical protein